MNTVQVYAAAHVRAAEAPALAQGQPLMARAARAVAIQAHELMSSSDRGRILVLVGSGNNGADALYAAAQLCAVHHVDIVQTGARVHAAAWQAALLAGARPVAAEEAQGGYDLIIDGILGIGASPEPWLRGSARRVVDRLGVPTCPVLAVDLPSGIHPDTGNAHDPVLAATVTVTFGAVKSGLVRGRGRVLAGRIVLADIGIADALRVDDSRGSASVERIVDATDYERA